MQHWIKKASLAIGVAAATLAASAPADAQRWGRGGWRGGGYYHRGGDRAGAAVLGGILGLGVGAAIASSARPRYYGGYGYGYGYAPPPPPPPAAYYGYNDGYYDGYAPACWTERRYDPYYGYAVPVRICR